MLQGKGIISNLQKKILLSLRDLSDFNFFYLTGGTALAEFYLGHRKSYDLDIFTREENLILPFSHIAEKKLSSEGFSLKVVRRFSAFVEFELEEKDEKTRVQFAYDSPFHLEEPLDSNLGIKVNSYRDIIIDKLLAFTGRTEPRDAIDTYFILKKENIWELIKLASQKDSGFDIYWLALAFQKVKEFPDEIDSWPVEMLLEIDIRELKNKFSQLALEIMKKLEGSK
ncbi:nucleotidyl transferase AbiEii/AbiGii toxin family protein [Candidatus Calescamantes bacterium]|nr:nucleotidyl transferase AbiEii/AbiGii toxin family protein [Candidatus Calescamantes bacterium]